MNKNILMLFALFVGLVSFAQQERQLKVNEETSLIEATYYHDNGVVSQTGFYTLDGKLQGEWLSFDTDGNKSVSANYDNGKKVGKWFFWEGDSLKEVDYIDSKIVSVIKWDNKTKVAVRNR